jgi:hypothetical protein
MSEASGDFRSDEVARRALQFDFSLSLFRRNYDELRLFLTFLNTPRNGIMMAEVGSRWLAHEAMLEVMCLLHNFVAAAKSLIDHSRAVYRDLYEPCGAISQYQSEVDRRFVDDPLSTFIVDLRRMAQHQRLPSVRFNLRIENQSPRGNSTLESTFQLTVDDLRRFTGWTAPSREYLDRAGETIDIAAVTREYHDHVMAFYTWFREQQRAVHGDAGDEYARSAMHGLYYTNPNIFGEILSRVEKLEQRDPSTPVRYDDLNEALWPALTIMDARLLMLCHVDPHLWIDVAIAAIGRRFSVPDEVGPRLRALIR